MLVYQVATLSAAITIFLNYCIGKPSFEFSPYEIFSGYTIWLSKKRLKRYGLMEQYYKVFEDNIANKKAHEIIEISNDWKKIVYNAAEPFFTWERAVGMCIMCFGVWVSFFVGLFFFIRMPLEQGILDMLINVVFCHVVLRIFSKLTS